LLAGRIWINPLLNCYIGTRRQSLKRVVWYCPEYQRCKLTFILLLRDNIDLPQQNIFQLLVASRSFPEDVECTLRRMSFRRVSHRKSTFRQAVKVTGIPDDWYQSTMKVIVKSSGTGRSACDSPGSISNHRTAVWQIQHPGWEPYWYDWIS
jgi:hypothetical protein